MAKFDQIGLAYCIDNKTQAEAIARELSGAASFQHFTAGGDSGAAPLADQLRQFDNPIILLVSDNFLRSSGCMYRGLSMVQEHQHRILPVVIDGMQAEGPIHTSFERVTDIIQYINYWQDQYLDLRRQKRELSGLDEQTFNEHIRLVREISSEAGEFLRQLRSLYHLQHPELVVDDYHQLFIFVEDELSWQSFKARRQREAAAAPPPAQQPPQPEPVPAIEPIPTLEPEPEMPALNDLPGAHILSPAEQQELNEVIHAEPATETPADLEWEVDAHTPMEAQIEEPEPEAPAAAPTATADEQAALLVKKAWTLADDGQADTGINLLEVAISNYPADLSLRYHLALMLADKREDVAGATAQLEAILLQNPQHEDALFTLAEMADLSGDHARARQLFEQVGELNEDYPELWSRLGLLLSEHYAHDQHALVHALKKAAKQDPDNAETVYAYAHVLTQLPGKEDKARKYLQKTLALNPGHAQAGFDLATLLLRLGEQGKAHAAYLAAAAIAPELRTPEHDALFALPAPAPPAPVSPAIVGAIEHDALAALKDNIAQLEALLKAREEAEAKIREEAAALAAVPPAPKPGQGKTIFISGATSGIGRATALRFAAEGYRLIITGRRQERLIELQHKLQEELNAETLILNFDVRQQEAVQQAIDQLPEDWKQIDILINNAGKAKGLDFIHEGQLDHWEEMIDTNVKGLLYLTRAVSPLMVARNSGHIINVGSTAGKEVYLRGNVYCATKFAVEALTKSMRIDLHDKGIRVSQVSPAHVEETEFALVRFDGDDQRADQVYQDFQPLRADDVASAIYFIASQPAYVNVLDITLQATQQASSSLIDRSGRDRYTTG